MSNFMEGCTLKNFNWIKFKKARYQPLFILISLSKNVLLIFQLDQIQNGRLVAIIDFNMRNILETVPDS